MRLLRSRVVVILLFYHVCSQLILSVATAVVLFKPFICAACSCRVSKRKSRKFSWEIFRDFLAACFCMIVWAVNLFIRFWSGWRRSAITWEGANSLLRLLRCSCFEMGCQNTLCSCVAEKAELSKKKNTWLTLRAELDVALVFRSQHSRSVVAQIECLTIHLS